MIRIAFGLLLITGVPIACSSSDARDANGASTFVEPEGGNGGLPADSTLPGHYRREGLISSNSYQVRVTVLAADPDEARILGEDAGKQRAAELMQSERVISSRIGYYGRQEIRKTRRERRPGRAGASRARRIVHGRAAGL